MPSSPAASGPAVPGVDRLADLRTLGEQLPRFLRLVHALKASHAAEGRDRAALVLLFPLERLGPLRQGALAELVHADPSTVSRHVATLIEQGLVHRVADETDGRASRLVVTDAGRAALAQVRAEREAHLARVTAEWPASDLTTLTRLFGRLLDDLAACLPTEPTVAPVAAIPREKP
ncbi:MarR family transcriptional regulator [Geodermatophilus sp. DF01-2]|uniref:MarR family winged helix-turn-helix transcriptional regulator n=1 Tax=Geodermatophilus sp. DF01-2 TaxID=2559610 RepID=UPI0010738F1F|nr:MarR family transcriptional regulator [Geodermatophilus sp. DF01_2]TFV60467.1 MarR family transcriptional regulator [Geodermatophilus sp. DF01_2]